MGTWCNLRGDRVLDPQGGTFPLTQVSQHYCVGNAWRFVVVPAGSPNVPLPSRGGGPGVLP